MIKHFACIVALVGALGGSSIACRSVSDAGTTGDDALVTRSDAVARARDWVNARMPYCQAIRNGKDQTCKSTCFRNEAQTKPDWDEYRSDCSGLVSYAWKIPAHAGGFFGGRTTWGFAPFDTTVSTVISVDDLRPGDALNSISGGEHIVLFGGWVDEALGRAILIEEPTCGKTATESVLTLPKVSARGTTGTAFYGMTFLAIRFEGLEEVGASGRPVGVEISPRPQGDDFAALSVKGVIEGGSWVSQCNEAADGERVWQTVATGPDANARWAAAKYPQTVSLTCGSAPLGLYPVVFRSLAGDFDAWVAQCAEESHVEHVFRVDTEVDGHPAASFQYNQQNSDCP